jgi:hypothetical protein
MFHQLQPTLGEARASPRREQRDVRHSGPKFESRRRTGLRETRRRSRSRLCRFTGDFSLVTRVAAPRWAVK